MFDIFGLKENNGICLIRQVDFQNHSASLLSGDIEPMVCKIQHFSAIENEPVNGKEKPDVVIRGSVKQKHPQAFFGSELLSLLANTGLYLLSENYKKWKS